MPQVNAGLITAHRRRQNLKAAVTINISESRAAVADGNGDLRPAGSDRTIALQHHDGRFSVEGPHPENNLLCTAAIQVAQARSIQIPADSNGKWFNRISDIVENPNAQII